MIRLANAAPLVQQGSVVPSRAGLRRSHTDQYGLGVALAAATAAAVSKVVSKVVSKAVRPRRSSLDSGSRRAASCKEVSPLSPYSVDKEQAEAVPGRAHRDAQALLELQAVAEATGRARRSSWLRPRRSKKRKNPPQKFLGGGGSGGKRKQTGVTQARKQYTSKRKQKLAQLRSAKAAKIKEFNSKTKRMPKAQRDKARREFKAKVNKQLSSITAKFPTARGITDISKLTPLIRQADSIRA